MKNKKPINLDLRTIHFPITAVVSILHRISGVIIFFSVGFIIWLFKLSLSSKEGFNRIINLTHNQLFKFIFFTIILIILYHICSGIRHLLIDLGFLKQTLKIGKKTANLVIIITLLLFILTGVILW